MPPFLPVQSISRSQRIRLGRGPGSSVPHELNSGDTPYSLKSNSLIGPFYADLGNSWVRKDFQHHATLGALVTMGVPSMTVYTDLFSVGSGFALSAGSGWVVNVAAGTIQSRFTGWQIPVAATTVVVPGAPTYGTRTDVVYVTDNGTVQLVAGPSDPVAPTYNVLSVASSAALSAASFKLGFSYNGFWFVTGALTQATTGSALATAILAATGGPTGAALSAYAPGGSATGAGAAFSTGAVTQTVTFGGGLEGAVSNPELLTESATGGTLTVAEPTVGVGNVQDFAVGSNLIIGLINTPAGATSISNSTLGGTAWMLTS